MVHLGGAGLPLNRYLVAIEIPDVVWAARESQSPGSLPIGWEATPPGKVSLDFGDEWLRTMRSVVLEVPSSIAPEDPVVLINPLHPDAAGLAAAKVRRW
jgi:RES domain-containing protein